MNIDNIVGHDISTLGIYHESLFFYHIKRAKALLIETNHFTNKLLSDQWLMFNFQNWYL